MPKEYQSLSELVNHSVSHSLCQRVNFQIRRLETTNKLIIFFGTPHPKRSVYVKVMIIYRPKTLHG